MLLTSVAIYAKIINGKLILCCWFFIISQKRFLYKVIMIKLWTSKSWVRFSVKGCYNSIEWFCWQQCPSKWNTGVVMKEALDGRILLPPQMDSAFALTSYLTSSRSVPVTVTILWQIGQPRGTYFSGGTNVCTNVDTDVLNLP